MKSILYTAILSLISVHCVASEISLPVPRSQLQFPTEDLGKKTTPIHFDVGLSTWAPSNLQQPSRLSNTTNYISVQDFSFKIEVGEDVYKGPKFSLLALIGFSHLQLERTGQLNSGSTVIQQSEILNVFQVPISLKFLGGSLFNSWIHPLAKFSVSPLYSRTAAGSFGNGLSELNWAGFASLGFLIDLPKSDELSLAHNWSLASGIEKSQSLDSSQFNDTGFWVSVGLKWK